MSTFPRRKALGLLFGVPATAALIGFAGRPDRAAAGSSYPNLKVGSHGGNVKSLQFLLCRHGIATTADGVFGEQTKSAVKDFQGRSGLVVDGIAGPQTWGRIIVDARQGDKGDVVKAVQVQANTWKKNIAVDGDFGGVTHRAITEIQSARGLVVDGVVGPQTWVVLVGGGTGDGGGGDGGSGYAGLSAEQLAHGRTMIGVGKANGIEEYGWVIAIATALQESTLRNLNGGDRDSVGLFQQRPSMGWGSIAQCTDPVLATQAFYGVARHTNNHGLTDIGGWQAMSVTRAAQAVQRSGFPDAYAKWEGLAREIVAKQKDAAGPV